MKPTTIHNVHDRRKAVAGPIVAAFLAAGWTAAAQADSLQDPIKARAMCEKGGRAGSPAARPDAAEGSADRRGRVNGFDAAR